MFVNKATSTSFPFIFSKVSAGSSSKKVPPTVARNTLLASGGKLGKHQLSNLQQKLKNYTSSL
jgi:hypothetical protein